MPRADELELLRDIERASGTLFAGVGLADVAAHEPESVATLAGYVVCGRAWVVVEGDVPVGFALVDIEIWGENQRGELTTPGFATVMLPSRDVNKHVFFDGAGLELELPTIR